MNAPLHNIEINILFVLFILFVLIILIIQLPLSRRPDLQLTYHVNSPTSVVAHTSQHMNISAISVVNQNPPLECPIENPPHSSSGQSQASVKLFVGTSLHLLLLDF